METAQIRPARRFGWLGRWGWRARRKEWGFCLGEADPCYRWEHHWFETLTEAELWAAQVKKKPAPRRMRL